MQCTSCELSAALTSGAMAERGTRYSTFVKGTVFKLDARNLSSACSRELSGFRNQPLDGTLGVGKANTISKLVKTFPGFPGNFGGFSPDIQDFLER